MISANEIKRVAAETGIMDPTVIERDYILSWILKGIYQDNILSDALIFKGGTSIKKAYFNDFRFSVDLDFTLKKTINRLEKVFERVGKSISDSSGLMLKGNIAYHTEFGFTEVKIPYTRIIHPQGASINAFIHLDFREKMLFQEASRTLFYPYSDKKEYGNIKATVYSLKEMLVEKLRALYFQRHFSISKDLFDIWWLVENQNIGIVEIFPYLKKKCEIKGISCKYLLLKSREEFKKDYERNLLPLLSRSLKVEFEEIWATGRRIYSILQKNFKE